MNNLDVGKRIKEIRKSMQLTQKQFANRLMISQSYLSGVEIGNEKPNDKFLKFLCLEYGVSEKWLLSGEGEMYEDTYDYNKDDLADLSNKALATILINLTTASNVKYSKITSLLSSLSSIIDYSNKMEISPSLDFLDKIELLCINFTRMIEVLSSKYDANVHIHHENGLKEYYRELIDFLKNKNET